MEMEGSRRPFDRSRLEPGPKKPRLMEAGTERSSSNGSSFISQRAAASNSRSSDSIRGPYQQQQQHQELVSQYKTALAELTFNSKPIITNLTIIAGENLQSAKAIAATICNNIIEVPTEQKLPSLYLLDSIVKNIGRDYIKYFAGKLPEVFCKAYRQVEPSVHPGMRHLFGTWKGVFPPQQLQLIEKELGFTTGVNGSSSGTSRPDPQAQRPAHSIHVNPKYLEARQRLQQSTRTKGAVSDISSTLNVNENVERPEITTSVSSGRSWIDPSIKRAQKEKLNEHVPEKTISAAYGDSDYGSDVSRRSAFGAGRGGERIKEQGFDKPWYDSGTGKILSQRSGLDIKHGFQSISQKSATSDAHPQLIQSLPNRTSTLTDRSWKNSEEEEYMWDDVNSAAKDRWASEDSDKSDLENQLRRPQSIREVGLRADSEASADSLSGDERGQTSFGNQMSAMWSRDSHALDGARHSASLRSAPVHPEGYQTSFSSLSKAANSIGRTSFKSQTGSVHVGAPNFVPMNATLESRGSIVQQQRETLRAASPSAHSPMHQHPPSPSVITSNANQIANSLDEQYQPQATSRSDPRISQFSRRSNLDPRNQFSHESLAMPSWNAVSVNSQRQQPPNLQNASTLASSLQLRHDVQQESLESEYSGQTQNSAVPQISDFPNPSSTSSLLAAVLKSGIIGSKSSSGTTPSSLDKGALSSQASAQPPLPSGLPPAQFSPPGPRIPPASISSLSLDKNASNTPNYNSQRNVEPPPLPPGPPPTLVEGASLQPLNAPKSASSPLSSILSTLVAKGLISASKESPTYTPSDTPPQTQNHIPPASSMSIPALSAPISSSIPFLAPEAEITLSKPAAKTPDALLRSTKEQAKSLIGLAFKPDVIRKSHPDVISELLDDVPHQCGICGFGLKLQEKLDRHLEWHALRNPDVKLLNSSRKWYLNSGEWIAGFGGLPCDKSKGTIGGSNETSECTEAVVPADESQCVCVLCGELFEDFYNEESDKWMFKGAVYMSIPGESGTQGPIVHTNCISESSCQELGLA
ncbi:polyadenylation and cleavage factor homolog 4 isoform X1 [Nicotiana tabacum]|uniref:Polyadenylation and cleavage factor homolog 4 isoform X1 n=1 Tax=Nicotiana tabacum TaxID=4097 RepID=A0A1S4AB50_TOBAC|nr:PREDICTED: polyadenylation and cleavage factor homolog 4-like isoform X1 [Nicotiana tabacum]